MPLMSVALWWAWLGWSVNRMLQGHSQLGLRQHVGGRPIFDWQELEFDHEFLGVAGSYLVVSILIREGKKKCSLFLVA